VETELYESPQDYYSKGKDIYQIKIFYFILSNKQHEPIKLYFSDYINAVKFFTDNKYVSSAYGKVMSWPIFVSFLAQHRIIKNRVIGDEVTKSSVYTIQDGFNNYFFKKIDLRINAINKNKQAKEKEKEQIIHGIVEKQLNKTQ
jgi:hypothetical protein